MRGGLAGMMLPADGYDSAANLEEIVRREIRKDRKKRERDNGDAQMLQTFENLNMLNIISSTQTSLVAYLQAPPVDPVTGMAIRSLQNPPLYGPQERAVLRWTANGVLLLLTALYNTTNALRAESMIGFLANGLMTTNKKGGTGLFGGGLGSLLIISSISGGNGFGLGSLFGGGTAALPTSGWWLA